MEEREEVALRSIGDEAPALESRAQVAFEDGTLTDGIDARTRHPGMVDEARTIAGREDVVEADGLECVADLEKALLVAREPTRALAEGKGVGSGAGGPDDEVGLERLGRRFGLGLVGPGRDDEHGLLFDARDAPA
jgi:hypothetical protein